MKGSWGKTFLVITKQHTLLLKKVQQIIEVKSKNLRFHQWYFWQFNGSTLPENHTSDKNLVLLQL